MVNLDVVWKGGANTEYGVFQAIPLKRQFWFPVLLTDNTYSRASDNPLPSITPGLNLE